MTSIKEIALWTISIASILWILFEKFNRSTERRLAANRAVDSHTQTVPNTTGSNGIAASLRHRRTTDRDDHGDLPTVTLNNCQLKPPPSVKHQSTQVDAAHVDSSTGGPLWLMNEQNVTTTRSDADLRRIAVDVHEVRQCSTRELLRLVELGLVKPQQLEATVGDELKAVHVRYVSNRNRPDVNSAARIWPRRSIRRSTPTHWPVCPTRTTTTRMWRTRAPRTSSATCPCPWATPARWASMVDSSWCPWPPPRAVLSRRPVAARGRSHW